MALVSTFGYQYPRDIPCKVKVRATWDPDSTCKLEPDFGWQTLNTNPYRSSKAWFTQGLQPAWSPATAWLAGGFSVSLGLHRLHEVAVNHTGDIMKVLWLVYSLLT